jgi:hypothetical protein
MALSLKAGGSVGQAERWQFADGKESDSELPPDFAVQRLPPRRA